MALNTDPRLQNQVIYSVYVRAHTPEGSFRAVAEDLDRIRALGADIIWFMPIHPIGVEGKKGSLGCPYANRDYRTVNPAYGTMEDFRDLVDKIHRRGMKVLIDVVYNHTSPDSNLYHEHPEFFYRLPDGRPGNKAGDWSDVIDLDYTVPALWDYQIESLCMWAKIVDGFRCDVASLVPLDFWKKARAEVAKVNPGCIWLAESVHALFANRVRAMGFHAARDTELFDAFDMEYDYDIWEGFERFVTGRGPLSGYLELLNIQQAMYPDNYNKMRCLENHDQPRIASRVSDPLALENFTAMLYFLKGATLLYAGQEFACTHRPSLFEQEVFPRDTGRDLSPLLRKLAEVKRLLGADDAFFADGDDESCIALMERVNGDGRKLGVFSLRGKAGEIAVDLPDGNYVNRIDNSAVTVKGGKLVSSGKPIVLILPR